LIVKAMVALTAIDERELRSELSKKSGVLPAPANLSVDSVPAKVLSQRPDIVASEREVIAAHAEMEQAKAQRLPSISLTGIIGSSRATAGGVSTDGSTWTVGPVVVTLPIFDAGVRRANAEAAKARYEAARTTYLASIRAAVREVESALVALESATARDEKVAAAAAGFLNSFNAVDARYRLGAASLFELEDARRSMVAANSAQIEQKREVVAAWISVYRAIGGGWSPSATSGTPNS
jgi:outer membrane protein TolC